MVQGMIVHSSWGELALLLSAFGVVIPSENFSSFKFSSTAYTQMQKCCVCSMPCEEIKEYLSIWRHTNKTVAKYVDLKVKFSFLTLLSHTVYNKYSIYAKLGYPYFRVTFHSLILESFRFTFNGTCKSKSLPKEAPAFYCNILFVTHSCAKHYKMFY